LALSISQAIAVSYNEVLNEKRKPENQWGDHSFMNELERMGAIERVNGSPVLEKTLDYKANPGAEFQVSDLAAVSTSKTDVITAAQYTTAQLQIPIVWSRRDEAENSTPNQKVSLVTSLVSNAIETHDDTIEEALFQVDTNGFLGLETVVPTSGQGTVGGIDASLEAWWRNGADTASSGTIVAKLTAMFNTLSRGSGSNLMPKMLVSDAATQAVYEATQQAFVRYMDTKEADAGFKVIAFKTARWSFSQYADANIYFLNPKCIKLSVVKQAYRLLGDTIEFEDAAGFIRKVYTLAQLTTNNKSRLGVVAYS
jgi:hypothetical protein